MADAKRTLKIPITWGRNRVRGKQEGAMFDDDHGKETLAAVRTMMKAEVEAAGVTPTPEYMEGALRHLLSTYEDGYRHWQANRDDCIGFVQEFGMPSGLTVLMGDERVLARVPGC